MKRTLLAVTLFVFCVYCGFATREYYWDGVAFAITIERDIPYRDLLQPSHLIYCSVTRFVSDVLRSVGISVRALYLMQAGNILLATAAVYLMGRLLAPIGRLAPVLMALFAFSAVWWKFSTDANAYIPAILLLLLTRTVISRPEPRPILAGLLHAAGMLFHQLALFFFPAGIAFLYFSTGEPTERRRRILRYGLTSSLSVAAVYVAAYFLQSPHTSFSDWLTTHSPDSAFSFNVVRNFMLTFRGTQRLFLGGKVGLFGFSLLWSAGLVLLAGATTLLIRSTRALPIIAPENLRPLIPDVVWIASYVVFLFFWLPQNTFYRMFYLPPVILVAGALLSKASRPVIRALPGMLLLLVLLWNWTFFIYPHSREVTNRPLHFALSRLGAWPAGSMLAYRGFHPDLWTMSYFSPQMSWLDLTGHDLAYLEQVREESQRSRTALFLEGTTVEWLKKTAEGRSWLAQYRTTDRVEDFGFIPVR